MSRREKGGYSTVQYQINAWQKGEGSKGPSPHLRTSVNHNTSCMKKRPVNLSPRTVRLVLAFIRLFRFTGILPAETRSASAFSLLSISGFIPANITNCERLFPVPLPYPLPQITSPIPSLRLQPAPSGPFPHQSAPAAKINLRNRLEKGLALRLGKLNLQLRWLTFTRQALFAPPPR